MNNLTLSQTLWTIWIHTFMNYKLQHLHANKTMMTYKHNVVQNVISNKTLIIFPLASKHLQLLSWPMKCCFPFQNLKLNKIMHSTKMIIWNVKLTAWNPEIIAPETAIAQCENLMQELRFPQSWCSEFRSLGSYNEQQGYGWTPRPLKMKAACSFEMSGIDNPANQCWQPRRVKFWKCNVFHNSAFSVCGCWQPLGKKY